MKNAEPDIRIADMSEEHKKQNSPRMPLVHSTAAKVTAFFLLIVMTVVLALSVVSAVIMAGFELYNTPESVILYETFEAIAREDCDTLVPYVVDGNEEMAVRYVSNSSIAEVALADADTGEVLWNWNDGMDISELEHTDINISWTEYSYTERYGETIMEVSRSIDVNMSIVIPYGIHDDYYLANELIELAYGLLYWVYVIGVLALICAVACFVFLMCSAGHRRNSDKVVAGWGTRVPFDLLTLITVAICFALVYLVCAVIDEAFYYEFNFILLFPMILVPAAMVESVVVGWSMSLAVRVKLGGWWRNTLVWRVLKLIWHCVKFIAGQLRRFFGYLRNLPLIPKALCSVVGITAVELIVFLCCWWESDNLFVFWIVEKAVVVPVIIHSCISLKKLQKAGEALSQGDLNYQVDTQRMWGDFKHHGDNLNSIAEGMVYAVNEQMKSERMKTELITNVSHDLKTPLTSIVNYADLISKETCDNPKIDEYSQVLLRSSQRLKRLIEDLVEASKASTGNLEVNLTPCNANILITQAVGEYKDKLQALSLDLISTQPTAAVMIMADGRRLWRVFDNLINNVSKYAQKGTRVYLSLEQIEDEAVITLKNTSGSQLNISAQELMERFVRGDESRTTEGNGLGLSIARSLTELQGGQLQLDIDGDLFKVTLKFPAIK